MSRAARRSRELAGSSGQLVRQVLGGEFREGPVGRHGRAGFQGHLDQRLAAVFAELREGNGAGGGHLDALGLQHRGQPEDLLLPGAMGRGIMAAGALGLHPEEGGGEDGGFGGQGHVVLRRNREPGGSSVLGATAQTNQFGDQQIERLAVLQGLQQPPAERARIVQGGVQDVRILGQHVLPVAHRVVRRPGIREQSVDRAGAAIGGPVRLECSDLRQRGGHAHRVEGYAAQEGEVIGQRGEGRRYRRKLGPDGPPADPGCQELGFRSGKPRALGRHLFVRIGRQDAL